MASNFGNLPKPGDLIFYKTNNIINRVGIVSSVNSTDNTFKAINVDKGKVVEDSLTALQASSKYGVYAYATIVGSKADIGSAVTDVVAGATASSSSGGSSKSMSYISSNFFLCSMMSEICIKPFSFSVIPIKAD